MAGTQPRNIDALDHSINEVLVHVGKVLRTQGKNGRKTASAPGAAKINESNISFNITLDNFETELLRAKAILRRDLDIVKAKKSTMASSVSAAKQETPVPPPAASAPAPAFAPAPPAAMDIDSEETAPASANAEPKIKSEFGPDKTNANAANANPTNPAKPSMAPVPNMDIDTPVPPPVVTPVPVPAPAPPTSVPMSASSSNRSQGKQPANGKAPVIKKELSRSPQQTTKPVPVPGARNPSIAGLNGVGKATAAVKKANSPAATRVPSPAASRATASPAASKVPSPVLVKSVASPANKAFGSQPPTPTLNKATASNLSKTASQSSSGSASVSTTSPVLTKKSAAAKAVSKSTTPVPVPRIPTPVTAPVVPPPAPAAAPAAAPVPKMESSMDNFFDLTSPTANNDPTASTDQGFTNMQFSLVPMGADGSKQQQQQQQQQQIQQQQKKQQAAKPPQAQAQQAAMDDFEFDVEKFATDAAQNLLTDNSYAAAPGSQSMPQPQAQMAAPAQADTAMGGTGSIDDDLFKFIDENMEGLGDDTTTNFDELFMDNMDTTDSVDLDTFFDA